MKRENTEKSPGRIGCKGSRYRGHDPDRTRQSLRNGRLNDYVGGMAKRAIGLNCLPVSVRMPNLHDPAKDNEGTA